ncbi:MAG: hypothetical protein Q8K58_13565 [Acidimicrobiales bacterium]|nr:hypothetical protein [Acidimicrobiales bacterium]
MADDPKHRLLQAVDGTLIRRSLGDTSARIMTRAASETCKATPDGRDLVIKEIVRVSEAGQRGALPEETVQEVVAALMAGITAPGSERPKRTRRGAPGATRNNPRRQLSRVPDGTRVFYDGVGASIRSGRITIDDGGGAYETPTPAAQAVTNQSAINGWDAWRLADGRKLCDVYDANAWPSS